MSTDERPDSLAAQAASWVPPWERPAPPVPDPPAPVPPADEPFARANQADDTTAPADADVPAGGLLAEPDAGTPDAALTAGTPAAAPESTGGPSAAGDAVAAAAVDPPAAAPADPTSRPSDNDLTAPAGDPTSRPSDNDLTAPSADPTSRLSVSADLTAPAADPARVVDDRELRAALEAIMLVVDEPVVEMLLAQVLEQPTERVATMLESISADYTAAGHGFDLRRAAGGWRLYTRPEYADYVERFILDGQSLRLTQAALETLAVIAYKQPVSRSRISAIRGVNCDGVMRTLVSRGLVEECGTEPESGAFLYRTTVLFLEKLGLNSVDQLPPLAPFLPDDVEEVLDAQR